MVKMLAMLGINKVLAIYVGPAGYAALGQFQNAIQITTTFASGAINTGVTKYTAEYHDREDLQHSVWRTAGTIAVIGALTTGLIIALLHKLLARIFLQDQTNSTVFVWFGGALLFFVLNALLLAILNGKKEISRYVLANIAGSIFAIVATAFLAIHYGLYGALTALATYQSAAFIATLVLILNAKWFSFRHFVGKIDKRVAMDLAKFTAMALTSAVCAPASEILVRDYIGRTLGWTEAGYWEAMTRISAAYLTFITLSLSVYYLPRLAELHSPRAIRNEVVSVMRLVVPAVAVVAIAIWSTRDMLIKLLLSTEFLPIRDLFAWQMLGDVFKTASWVVAYLMLAKAMTRIFIITEVLASVSFVVLARILTNALNLEGAIIAFTLNYAIYLIALSTGAIYYYKKAIRISSA